MACTFFANFFDTPGRDALTVLLAAIAASPMKNDSLAR
jgi:hypothetical protein